MPEANKKPKKRTRSGIALGMSLIPALLGLCGCGASGRYRITATVEVDGKVYSGTSVQAFRCYKATGHGMDVDSCHAKGEAVAVPVADRGYLFLIIKGKTGDENSMVQGILGAAGVDPFSSQASIPTDTWSLPVSNMPKMVTFGDTRLPTTVKYVDPNDLPSAFGPGVVLKSVLVEGTHENITKDKLLPLLPWLKSANGATYLTGKTASFGPSPAENLQLYDFRHGI